jgi:VCBS repeat protein
MRIEVFGYLAVGAWLAAPAFACTDDQMAACKTLDGRTGTKVCVDGKWRSCQATLGSGTGGGTDTPPATCAIARPVVEFSGLGDPQERDRQRACFVKTVQLPNTIVRLGPDVDFSFGPVRDHRSGQDKVTEVFSYPIVLGSCVTLESTTRLTGAVPCPETVPPNVGSVAPAGPSMAKTVAADRLFHASVNKDLLRAADPLLPPPLADASARTSRSMGPVLRFGDHSKSAIPGTTALLQVACSEEARATGVAIRGFRLYGPTFGDQKDMDDYVGIRVENCADTDISNMDIAGWGGSAVEVRHPALSSQPTSWPGQASVRIHDNYLHHNLHTSNDIGSPHSAGYGVTTSERAFSNIYHNVFDYNNHDVTADGNAGGYIALQNLILKGGGQHSKGRTGFYMHVFDVHGDQKGCWPSGDWTCGHAAGFNMTENTFQYKNSDDIGIRGTVRFQSSIQHNVFARSSERNAIDLFDDKDIAVDHNDYASDTYGRYTTCDFDGDGVDDLFLATGVTWWYSSGGQFPWVFMQADRHSAGQLAFGDFDHDGRCDILEDHPTQTGVWYISRGGVGEWEPLARDVMGHALNFGHPLSEVRFGNFDPDVRDHTGKLITGAFWRDPMGGWFVTPINKVDWQRIGGSSFPLSDLKFGDFDGDGVTDVLAVEEGHWAISSAGRSPWTRWNQSLGEPVKNLYVAKLDASDHSDDILKLDYSSVQVSNSPFFTTTIKWWRSQNGTSPWELYKSYVYSCNSNADDVAIACGTTYLGRFAAIARGSSNHVDQKSEGAGILTIDAFRQGHFFNPTESVNGRPAEWQSDSAYFKY